MDQMERISEWANKQVAIMDATSREEDLFTLFKTVKMKDFSELRYKTIRKLASYKYGLCTREEFYIACQTIMLMNERKALAAAFYSSKSLFKRFIWNHEHSKFDANDIYQKCRNWISQYGSAEEEKKRKTTIEEAMEKYAKRKVAAKKYDES